MSRRKLGPRLYLDKKRQQWIIRDHLVFKRTGLPASDTERATLRLQDYVSRRREARTIYFITCLAENFPVKIGRTFDLNGRMAALRTGLPYPPVLLASFNGKPSDEQDIFKKFTHLRLQGEWFKRAPDLMQYISGLKILEAPPPAPTVSEFAAIKVLAMQ